MLRRNVYLICLLLFATVHLIGQDDPVYGPENGSLLAVGGGSISFDLIKLFKDRMGGWDEPLVVVPTASSDGSLDTASIKQRWLSYGFTEVSILHTRNRVVANTKSFIAPLLVAKGVWFSGGRQWRLVDAYYTTKTLDAFWGVLDRGGIIGGSSAGASIQASFLARGWEFGNQIIISPDTAHQVGFGFLKNSAIDQHIDARDRWDEMAEVVNLHPEILGIGLSEGTAILVEGDCIEVFGPAQVAITDSTRLNNCMGSACYELLEAEDYFNIQTRLKGECDFLSTTQGKNELAVKSSIIVYPNPSSGDFIIKMEAGRMDAIHIYNFVGAKVQEILTSPTTQIGVNTSNLSNGTYLIQIKSDIGNHYEKVILKRG